MYLDLFIAIPLLWGMYRGFSRGFIIELCTLMALILGVYGAAEFGNVAGDYLEKQFNTDPRVSLVLAFSILFVIIVILVHIFGRLLESVIKMVALGMVNKLFGMLFGTLKFALILSGLLYMLNGLPLTEKLLPYEWKRESLLYQPIEMVAPKLFPILKKQRWLEDIRKHIENFKETVV